MSAAIIQVESEKFSRSLLAIQDEPLAEMVIQGCQQFARIVPYAVELRKRFKSQPRGKANIAGCQTWEEFCEKRLDRGVRAIQIAIKTYTQRASLTEGMPCPSGKKRYDSVEAARAEDDSASARIYNCRQCRGIHFDTRQTNTAAPVACVCPDCGEPFESKRKLKDHAFTVHKIDASEVASFLHRAVGPPPSEPVEPVDAEFIDMPAERTTALALPAAPTAVLTTADYSTTFYAVRHKASGQFLRTKNDNGGGVALYFDKEPAKQIPNAIHDELQYSSGYILQAHIQDICRKKYKPEDFEVVEVRASYKVTVVPSEPNEPSPVDANEEFLSKLEPTSESIPTEPTPKTNGYYRVSYPDGHEHSFDSADYQADELNETCRGRGIDIRPSEVKPYQVWYGVVGDFITAEADSERKVRGYLKAHCRQKPEHKIEDAKVQCLALWKIVGRYNDDDLNDGDGDDTALDNFETEQAAKDCLARWKTASGAAAVTENAVSECKYHFITVDKSV